MPHGIRRAVHGATPAPAPPRIPGRNGSTPPRLRALRVRRVLCGSVSAYLRVLRVLCGSHSASLRALRAPCGTRSASLRVLCVLGGFRSPRPPPTPQRRRPRPAPLPRAQPPPRPRPPTPALRLPPLICRPAWMLAHRQRDSTVPRQCLAAVAKLHPLSRTGDNSHHRQKRQYCCSLSLCDGEVYPPPHVGEEAGGRGL
jgi:hypothetical protein